MKKLGALLLIVCASVLLGACSPFHGTQTQTLAETNPQVTTVLVQLNPGVTFDAGRFTALVTYLKTTPTAPVTITDARFLDELTETAAQNTYYTLELTLSGVPAQVVTVETKPFTITRTQTVFNPISLLPTWPEFTYGVGINTTRRPSQVSTPHVGRDTDGSYLYLWTTGDPIVFTDIYPNRPLYYLLALAATAVISVLIYLSARYISCKKRQKNI